MNKPVNVIRGLQGFQPTTLPADQRATAPNPPSGNSGDLPCAHCGAPVFRDDVDGVWRHSESEAEGCGSAAPDGDDGTSATPLTPDASRLISAGLTVEQAVAAVTAGLDVEQFVEHSIRNGITFAEAMDAHAVIGDIGYYNFIREEAGCGHAAAMSAFAEIDGELEHWAIDYREAKQQRQFNPWAERADDRRSYQCEPGTEVFLEAGRFLSNTFVGASQAFGKVFRRHRMGADDRVVEYGRQRLVVTADGRVFSARFKPEMTHLFERGSSGDPAPKVGYRCDPVPFGELGGPQEI